jgi:GNAT superfamily N-acetyltransferase
MTIVFATNGPIQPREAIDLLHEGAFTRPMDDESRVQRMFDNGSFVITARDGGRLVGFTRGITDFAYQCLIAEVVVAKTHKGTGIGKEMLRLAREEAGPEVNLILNSSAEGHAFYEHLGWEPVPRAWRTPRFH